jgi:hypothetical protein
MDPWVERNPAGHRLVGHRSGGPGLILVTSQDAREQGLHLSRGSIPVSKDTVREHRAAAARALAPSRHDRRKTSTPHCIVGMMGVEPIQAAVKRGPMS